MNIFKSFTLKWWQGSIFKVCCACFGIIIGAYFHDFFLTWMPLVAVVCAVTAIYLTIVWWRQVKTPTLPL